MFYHGDDVWRVAPAGALRVVGVYCAPLEGVERVCVDETLHVELVADTQAGVDGCRRRAPVLVQFEPALACADLFTERGGLAVVAFACDPDVHGELIAGLQHLARVVRPGGAGRC